MGENPEIEGRTSVRTPMQWSAGRNGGFSDVAPSRLVAPLPGDGYAPAHVNVTDQYNDPGSLLHFVRELAARYRMSPEIGWGAFAHIPQEEKSLLVHTVTAELGQLVAIHNFAPAPATAVIPGGSEGVEGPEGTALVDLFGPERIEDATSGVELEIPAYGHRWFRVSRPGDGRIA